MRDRIRDVDVLRGFALLGILIVDVTAAELAGKAFRPRMLRRSAGLFAIGALTMVVLLPAVLFLHTPPAGQQTTAWPLHSVSPLTVLGPTCLAMFLLGLVAGRRLLLAGITGGEPILRTVQLVGFPAGIAGGIYHATAGGTGTTTTALVSVLTAPLLAAAYAATLLIIVHSPCGSAIGSALAAPGRMALSNYLGQSVATLLIFTGAGLGLAGRVSPLGTVLIAVAVFAAQAAISRWWLARLRFGPAEWLLRWMMTARRPSTALPAASPGPRT
jgi:uncharacterized protein